MRYVMILLFLLTILLAGCSASTNGTNYDALAKCLTEKGVTMYGTTWCPHCNNQKKMFGTSFQYIMFVDCDAKPGTCSAAGVQGYPTWVINGTNYPGEQTAADLARYSGCSVE